MQTQVFRIPRYDDNRNQSRGHFGAIEVHSQSFLLRQLHTEGVCIHIVGTGEVEARSVVALPSTPPERSLGRRSCRLIRASSILN